VRFPRPRTWLGWLGLAVVAYLAAAAVMLLLAKQRAQAGLDDLERARDTLTTKDLIEGQGDDVLASAGDLFDASHSLTHSPVLLPVRLLPVVGRQVRAIDGMTGAAAAVTDIARDALRDANDSLAGGLPQGTARLALLDKLETITGTAAERMRALDLGPSDALVGPVETAHTKFVDELDGLLDGLDRASTASGQLATVLKGPSSYLLLAANNAEMRVGSGMFLSAGTVTMQDGTIEIGDMTPVEDLDVPPGAVPITDADFAGRWGWTNPNVEWRNLGFTPRFAVSADLAARMWVAAGKPPVDGVLAVDVVALQALLRATGPVAVEGGTVDADSVIGLLLHDQYAGLTQVDDQSARRERLAEVAKAVVNHVDTQGADVSTLADQLRVAARGRHLFAWATDPARDRGWQAAGLEGELDPDSVLVAVANEGGNKLDQYLRVDASVATSAAPGGGRAVRVELTLTSSAPAGDPPYILGVDPGIGAGVYPGFVTVELPRYATAVHADGGLQPVTQGGEGPDSQVVSVAVRVAPGTPGKVVVTFAVPAGIDALRIEPSARVPSVHWTAPGTGEWSDADGARTIDLGP
jgi:hypothetical protein